MNFKWTQGPPACHRPAAIKSWNRTSQARTCLFVRCPFCLPLLLNVHSQPLQPSGCLGLHVTWRDVIHYLTFQSFLGGPPLLHSWLSLPADQASIYFLYLKFSFVSGTSRIGSLILRDVKSEVFAASSFLHSVSFTVDPVWSISLPVRLFISRISAVFNFNRCNKNVQKIYFPRKMTVKQKVSNYCTVVLVWLETFPVLE